MKRPYSISSMTWSIVLLTLTTLLVFAPDAYLPMLARAFMLQWSVLMLLFALIALARKAWRVGGMAVCCGAALWVQLPMNTARDVMGHEQPVMRILHMNVWQPNDRFEATIREALNTDADVISVQEVGPEWAAALQKGLLAEYPFAHVVPQENCYGIALFSKRPFVRVRTIMVAEVPFIEAMLGTSDEPVKLLAVHASSPISSMHFRQRNLQWQKLSELLANSDTATVLVGDLNTVPWDKAFQHFCERSGMRSSGGNGPTWPSVGPFALIPLDHVLVSPALYSSSVSTIQVPGSDHRGLLAEIRHSDHAN